jgi:ElaB/YqjD/DUF883 family membrane-anchored ribosome-binding protein
MDPVTEASAMLRDRAGQARDKVEGAVQSNRDRLELTVHKHPIQTVLISAGVGLLVGLVAGLLGRRSSN